MATNEGNTYLGVDLGSTKISVSLWRAGVAGNMERAARLGWETLAGGVEPNVEKIAAAAAELLSGSGVKPSAIGISGGGPVDPEKGVLRSVPNLPGWVEVPLARLLSERLGAPARLENDANACAVAEWRYGAGRGAKHMAFLTCSTGVGAGLILDGELYRGRSFLAGEAGHQVIVPGGLECGCGRRGCLEAYAGGAGIARRLRLLQAKDPDVPATAHEVIAQARAGDDFCKAFLRETAQFLAMGLANLVFILNPEKIVLGTIVADAGELILAPLRRYLAQLVWPSLLEGLEVVASALWPDLGDYAAMAVARELSEGRP